jgi:hypothetical protein
MTTQDRAVKALELAKQIRREAETPREVTTGEHAMAQNQLASLGVELADVILAQARGDEDPS